MVLENSISDEDFQLTRSKSALCLQLGHGWIQYSRLEGKGGPDRPDLSTMHKNITFMMLGCLHRGGELAASRVRATLDMASIWQEVHAPERHTTPG